MIGRLNHVAIAVPDLEAARAQYRDALGAMVGAPQDEPEHGVTVVFIELPNTKIELLYPLGADSPIRGFLDKNPAGGIHHICYEVGDIIAARDKLAATGARVALGKKRVRKIVHSVPRLRRRPVGLPGRSSAPRRRAHPGPAPADPRGNDARARSSPCRRCRGRRPTRVPPLGP